MKQKKIRKRMIRRKQGATELIKTEVQGMQTGKKVPTGISGFDTLVDGGFLPHSVILVSGNPGTGKTIFSFQFVYNGAKLYEEPGLFVSLEEPVDNIIRNMKKFGMADIEKLMKEKKLSIVKVKIFNFIEFKEGIEELVKRYGIKRVVIDSSAILGLFFETPFQIRYGLAELIDFLRGLGCTVVLTSEIEAESKKYSSFGIEEFVVDGIVVLFHKSIGNTFIRALSIPKMRGSPHSEFIYPVRITENGIKIFTEEALPKEFLQA